MICPYAKKFIYEVIGRVGASKEIISKVYGISSRSDAHTRLQKKKSRMTQSRARMERLKHAATFPTSKPTQKGNHTVPYFNYHKMILLNVSNLILVAKKNKCLPWITSRPITDTYKGLECVLCITNLHLFSLL